MRLYIATLQYRHYGRAIVSRIYAKRHLMETRPDVTFDHVQLYGTPDGLPEEHDGHDVVVAKYEIARRQFLAGDYDLFVALEDDMVVPEDALTRLLALIEGGADVGYGLYVWRHGSPRWSAYVELGEERGISISQRPDEARAAWGSVIDVAGVGMGCTIITRDVLERVPFQRRGLACNDWYLAVDAQAAGLVQRCDFGLVCGHIATEPSPRLLWPDPLDPDLFRVEFMAPPSEDEQRRYALWQADRQRAQTEAA